MLQLQLCYGEHRSEPSLKGNWSFIFYSLLFLHYVSLLGGHLASFPLPPPCVVSAVLSLLVTPLCDRSSWAAQPSPGADTVPSWGVCWAQPQLSEVKMRIKLSLTWTDRGGLAVNSSLCVGSGRLWVCGVCYTLTLLGDPKVFTCKRGSSQDCCGEKRDFPSWE